MHHRGINVLGLGLLALSFLYGCWPGAERGHEAPTSQPPAAGSPGGPPIPRSPSEASRREASRYWIQARERVSEELDRQEEWDANGIHLTQRERRRQSMMAMDAGGDLVRARTAAARAETLARTADETYQAAVLLSRIECELGHHEAELRQSRLLVRLQPRDPLALTLLEHAAVCTHRLRLARQAEAALAAVHHLRLPDPPEPSSTAVRQRG